MQDNISIDVNETASLFDVFDFFADNWKPVALAGLVGAVASAAFLAIVPRQYEANGMVEMAQVRSDRDHDRDRDRDRSVESPALLIERLKNPTTYTPEVIKSCSAEGQQNSEERLAKTINVSAPKNLLSIVEINVRRENPEAAKNCVNSLFEMVRSQQNDLLRPFQEGIQTRLNSLQVRLKENQAFVAKMDKAGLYQTVYLAKRDETIYLMQQIEELEQALTRDRPARLVVPIYASSKAVAPKTSLTLLVGIFAGLAIGLIVAVGNKVLVKWQRASNRG